ncbi:MAG: membrane protein insertion efficiency factor YidD [Syntrophomonadaceae bacterium]|nr:membrane protein insertion efficiency factor YidD [Syntrophomonadaceae bacterium]
MGSKLIIGCIKLYRGLVSSWSPPSCRYIPSCSRYALEAVEKYGPIKGLWLSVCRVLRCHPWGGYGYDPVPDKLGGD